MFINDTFYKETDNILEMIVNKFLFKRRVYRIGELVFIEVR